MKCYEEEYPHSSALAAMPFLLSCICDESDKFTDAQEAILEVFPLDQYVEKLVYLMERVHGDNADVFIWKIYEGMLL